VDDVIECPKCLECFESARNVDKQNEVISWKYKAIGPFSLPGYADGALAVLSTLDFFRNTLNLKLTPCFSFKIIDPKLANPEIDLAMLWEETIFGEKTQGELFIECKTFKNFDQKDYNRQKSLMKLFPGSVIAFCTLKKCLNRDEINQIKEIANIGRKYYKDDKPRNPVLILTQDEILSLLRPPFSWSEEDQAQYRHIHSLFDLCLATQQKYLGLPHWCQDWTEEFEKKKSFEKNDIVKSH
jgi:hypothetical protein